LCGKSTCNRNGFPKEDDTGFSFGVIFSTRIVSQNYFKTRWFAAKFWIIRKKHPGQLRNDVKSSEERQLMLLPDYSRRIPGPTITLLPPVRGMT